MKTRFKALMVALLFLVSGAIAVAGPAETVHAAGECNAGSHTGYVLIDQYSMYAESSTYKTGTLELYWSNTEGRNCAIARAYGDNYGKKLWRGVWLNVSGHSTIHSDTGYYYYYAGPVWTGVSRGDCVDVEGKFKYLDGGLASYRKVTHVHCG